jgi:hypothetical protein
MAFSYAHRRPLTPITPVHSPHPSGGSVRSRTPGQLSLHDYRKEQVTPSPPAVRGQKTVKRKTAASSLKNVQLFTAENTNAWHASTYTVAPSTTTPPYTPSLDPPTPYQLQSSPPGSFHFDDFTFLPEGDHRASSEISLSPPQSPSLLGPTSLKSLLPSSLPSPTTTTFASNSFSFPHTQPSDVLPQDNLIQGVHWNPVDSDLRYEDFSFKQQGVQGERRPSQGLQGGHPRNLPVIPRQGFKPLVGDTSEPPFALNVGRGARYVFANIAHGLTSSVPLNNFAKSEDSRGKYQELGVHEALTVEPPEPL